MKKLIRLSFIAMSVLFLVGCSEDDNPIIPPTKADEILDALTILVNGEEGLLTQGALPSASAKTFPAVASFPDLIKTTKLSKERIDLVFDIDSNIKEIYFTIDGASEYYTFTKNEGSTGDSTESVSITIDIPETIDNGSFSTTISVKDENEFVSETVVVNTVVDEEEAQKRVIHFADYSYNSTLSTLDFDSGEVINIGSIGHKLTDIAFFNGQLYGISATSKLISIDLATGEGTVIGNTGVPNVNALEGSETVLYGATRNGQFIAIDPTTAEGTVISSFDLNAFSSGDLVFDKNNEFLYGSLVVPGSSTDQIVTIDPTTGATNFLGETGYNEVWGLAFFRNQLIGLTRNGEFIIIDPKTGKGTFIENTEAFSAGGAAAIRN